MSSLLNTDGYKLFHKEAYHPEITEVYSNFTSRNGKYSNTIDNDGRVVFVGLQAFLIDLIEDWEMTFFTLPKDVAIKNFKRVVDSYLGLDYDATHFEELHDLGYLPIKVKALEEGTFVPYGVPCMTFVNTVEGFQWLTNYLETLTSTENWPIQTSATTSVSYLKKFKEYAKFTGLDEDMVPFQGHDFSFRGMFGKEAAAMSGFGHLCSGFVGTDTLPAILFAEKYYGADVEKELVGCSVPATEHSTATSYIMAMEQEEGLTKLEAEVRYVQYLMKKVPTGVLSHVSDSFDFWTFVTKGLPLLKEDIILREGTLVIRPDSGDPVEVLCGIETKTLAGSPEGYEDWKVWVADDLNDTFNSNLDSEDPHQSEMDFYNFGDKVFEVEYTPDLNRHDKTYYYVDNYGDDVSKCSFKEIVLTPEQKGLIELLWDIFGGTITKQGFKLLDDHIGAIYGDAITLERQDQILSRLAAKGFASKIVLGIGSYSFQMVSRDTHGSAVKATHAVKGGKDMEVFKDPKTDSTKKSAKGLLRVDYNSGGELTLYDKQTREEEEKGLLTTVMNDGNIVRHTTLQEIRQKVSSQL